MKIFNRLGIIGVILCLGLTIFGASRAAALTKSVDRAITETELHANNIFLRFGYSIVGASHITIQQEVREGYTEVTALYTFNTEIGEDTKIFTGFGHYLFEENEEQGKDKSPCGSHPGNYSPKQGSQLVQRMDITLALSGDGTPINSTYSSDSYLTDNERYETIVATQTGNVPKNYEVDK